MPARRSVVAVNSIRHTVILCSPALVVFALLALAAVVLGAEKSVSGKPDRLLLIDETYAARDRMPPLLRAGLEKAGWTKMSFIEWKDLSADHLRQARAVAIVGLPRSLEATERGTSRERSFLETT